MEWPDRAESKYQYRGKEEHIRISQAFVQLGDVEVELIQPVEGNNAYQDFLDETGGGIHHVLFEVSDIDPVLHELAKSGVTVLQSGTGIRPGTRWALLDTREAVRIFGGIAPSSRRVGRHVGFLSANVAEASKMKLVRSGMTMEKAQFNSSEDCYCRLRKVGGHARPAYQALPTSEFVAVCDVATDRAEAFAAKFQVKGYTDLAEMLHREKVDVLSICTQHTQHPAAVEIAAAAGTNAISEKPLAVDLVSCDQAIAAARAAGIKLGVVSQRRWYEPVPAHEAGNG